ncbi:MAG: potassium channel family protein [Pseudomonadota bacterium]
MAEVDLRLPKRAHVHFQSAPYFWLLGCELLLIILAPTAESAGSVRILIDVSMSAVLISGLWLISHETRAILIGSALAIIVIGGSFLDALFDLRPWTRVVILASGCVFFVFLVTHILRDVFLAERVSLHTIIGAICAYVMLGIIWGMIYSIINVLDANAFLAATDGHPVGQFMYFSVATLTTVGYGDIVPTSPLARGMSSVEAIVGQVFMTVLVARLVGLHLAQDSELRR